MKLMFTHPCLQSEKRFCNTGETDCVSTDPLPLRKTLNLCFQEGVRMGEQVTLAQAPTSFHTILCQLVRNITEMSLL